MTDVAASTARLTKFYGALVGIQELSFEAAPAKCLRHRQLSRQRHPGTLHRGGDHLGDRSAVSQELRGIDVDHDARVARERCRENPVDFGRQARPRSLLTHGANLPRGTP